MYLLASVSGNHVFCALNNRIGIDPIYVNRTTYGSFHRANLCRVQHLPNRAHCGVATYLRSIRVGMAHFQRRNTFGEDWDEITDTVFPDYIDNGPNRSRDLTKRWRRYVAPEAC
jgi:hypothetical protein